MVFNHFVQKAGLQYHRTVQKSLIKSFVPGIGKYCGVDVHNAHVACHMKNKTTWAESLGLEHLLIQESPVNFSSKPLPPEINIDPGPEGASPPEGGLPYIGVSKFRTCKHCGW